MTPCGGGLSGAPPFFSLSGSGVYKRISTSIVNAVQKRRQRFLNQRQRRLLENRAVPVFKRVYYSI